VSDRVQPAHETACGGKRAREFPLGSRQRMHPDRKEKGLFWLSGPHAALQLVLPPAARHMGMAAEMLLRCSFLPPRTVRRACVREKDDELSIERARWYVGSIGEFRPCVKRAEVTTRSVERDEGNILQTVARFVLLEWGRGMHRMILIKIT
jgi:hypothetical protein